MIDLDPSLEIEPRIMEATAIVGAVLTSLGLSSVPKTSGATGVQIIVPIETGVTFDGLRKIGHFVGRYVTEKHPNLFTLERLKKNRGDKIYFDYLQHYSGKTLAAPYTPRARPFATVSTPLLWEEVQQNVSPSNFHLLNIEERLLRMGDLLEKVPHSPLNSSSLSSHKEQSHRKKSLKTAISPQHQLHATSLFGVPLKDRRYTI